MDGTITGANYGIFSTVEPVTITNYGKIVGAGNAIGIAGGGTVINEAGASLSSTTFAPSIYAYYDGELLRTS